MAKIVKLILFIDRMAYSILLLFGIYRFRIPIKTTLTYKIEMIDENNISLKNKLLITLDV